MIYSFSLILTLWAGGIDHSAVLDENLSYEDCHRAAMEAFQKADAELPLEVEVIEASCHPQPWSAA